MLGLWITLGVIAFLAIGYIVSYFVFNNAFFERIFGRIDPKVDLEDITMRRGHYLPIREEVLRSYSEGIAGSSRPVFVRPLNTPFANLHSS